MHEAFKLKTHTETLSDKLHTEIKKCQQQTEIMKITWKEGERDALDLSRLTNKKNKSEHAEQT